MNHLRIEQGGLDLNVSSAVISKMYTEAYVDATHANPNCLFAGGITAEHAKLGLVTWLNSMYPNLTITVTNGYYMDFADPEVERICALNWGDGVGITQAQMSSVTQGQLGYTFRNNPNITSFDEFKYFTNVSLVNGFWSEGDGLFYNCPNMTSIDVLNLSVIGMWQLSGCTSLTTIKNFSGTKIDYCALSGCTSLTSVNLSNVVEIEGSAFYDCTSLDVVANGLDFTKLTYLGSGYTFLGCRGITEVLLPNASNLVNGLSLIFAYTTITKISNIPTLVSIGGGNYRNHGVFEGCNQLDTIDLTLCTSLTTVGRWLQPDNVRIIKLPSSVTSISESPMLSDRDLSSSTIARRALVMYATTPPNLTIGSDYYGNLYVLSQNLRANKWRIYVPDSTNDTVLNAYKSASGWSMAEDVIYPMSLFAIDFPND